MSNITEHDSKEKGKSDEVENCRIDFLVLRNAVSSEDLIGSSSILIELEKSRLI